MADYIRMLPPTSIEIQAGQTCTNGQSQSYDIAKYQNNFLEIQVFHEVTNKLIDELWIKAEVLFPRKVC